MITFEIWMEGGDLPIERHIIATRAPSAGELIEVETPQSADYLTGRKPTIMRTRKLEVKQVIHSVRERALALTRVICVPYQAAYQGCPDCNAVARKNGRCIGCGREIVD
jgi:hypothetical protein